MRTRALHFLVLSSFAALCFTPLATSSANAANSPTSQAVSGFQGCTLAATKPVDVLIIMDQTQSLRTTDPGNLRIVGLKAALRSMASEHDTNANVTYRVKMVGFGRSVIAYNSGAGLGSWSSVTSDTLSSLYQYDRRFCSTSFWRSGCGHGLLRRSRICRCDPFPVSVTMPRRTLVHRWST